MLEIYNSLSKKKEPFRPLVEGKVSMYVCGMTVYDFCHLGHARVLVVFDVVARYLRDSGYELTYVRNITDIDDKIIKRANENKEPFTQLTERFIKAMHEDCEALNVLAPDQEPRATSSMSEIISMIKILEEKGFTYLTDTGDVYYNVSQFNGYGKLSGRKIEEQIPGKRVEVDKAKKNPEDFVLWKAAKPEEPSWESPWSQGRPGWHIECSAMSTDCLGEQFDIHGGGMDLKFPHHENEIAQTEGCTGKHAVNYWMHNGFVQVVTKKEGEGAIGDEQVKMSKSLGNFFTIREVLSLYRAEEIRYFILNSHYRSPLNYSQENLELARSALKTLYTALRNVPDVDESEGQQFKQKFNAAMDDDFNTAGAISVLFDLAHDINKAKASDMALATKLARELKDLAGILGLLQNNVEQFLQSDGGTEAEGFSAEEIESYIEQRAQARANKDFAEGDKIRALLLEKNIVIEDSADGTRWSRQ
ncbi:Cysteinyl-tRNA synthetase [hydrothermal vent metagenome]|uniref:cysteine--tRNA ligase n=1 Tax=hydrothermal vent metagenome TaxID=652676 RepID=A0A3B0XQW4_9ZZZZ